MAVSAIGSSAASPYASSGRQVEPKRTPVSQDDIRGALARAHVAVTGRAASGATLDVLTAQASLETASGSKMYNYNFGGIKGASASGATAMLRTHEVLNGKDVEIKDGFRAYQTIDEGATDYVRLMQKRFPGAMQQAEKGDTDGFAHALKKSGYYTADESAYASGLRSLMGSSSTATSASSQSLNMLPALPNVSSMLGASSSPQDFANGPSLNRMMDAIGHVGSHQEVNDDGDDD